MRHSEMLRITVFIAAMTLTSIAFAQDNIPSSSLPADKVQFGPTGLKTDAGEIKAGSAYGDRTKGHHGTFFRWPAHFVSPLHYHTSDYFGIVIQGTVVNTQPGK